MSKFQNNSIFWIEVEKIKPNPYQPRKEFSDEKLGYLADSIRQYGVLQPLVVTRKEVEKIDGGLATEYELIAGERRLRASKIAGVSQVPAIIREGEEDEGAKLELAIIENLQREDLNPIDRALAFQRLAEEFGFKHTEIAKKVGKSREYVSNSLRLLSLPEEIQRAISSGKITEGHARPLMMLKDKPQELDTLFKEIVYKKLTVRDAEAIARKIAHDKIRKKKLPPDPEMLELEGKLSESFGTRVQIERREVGGKLTIDFFSNDDLRKILEMVHSGEVKNPHEMLDNYIKSNGIVESSMKSVNETSGSEEGQATASSQSESESSTTSRKVFQDNVVIDNKNENKESTESWNDETDQRDEVGENKNIQPQGEKDATYMMGSDFKPKTNSDINKDEELGFYNNSHYDNLTEDNQNFGNSQIIEPKQNEKSVVLDEGVEIIEKQDESVSINDSTDISKKKEKEENEDEDEDLYSVNNFTV